MGRFHLVRFHGATAKDFTQISRDDLRIGLLPVVDPYFCRNFESRLLVSLCDAILFQKIGLPLIGHLPMDKKSYYFKSNAGHKVQPKKMPEAM